MKKRIALLLSLALTFAMLVGCTGTPVVYYSECDCPDDTTATTQSQPQTSVPDGAALKTGLAILTDLSGSTSAEGETVGTAKFDVTLVAVTVDDSGVIDSCVIDSIGTSVHYDGSGTVTSDLAEPVYSKNELGEAYGMKQAGSAHEWNEQVAALAAYAIDKTADEVKHGATDASGKAADADLASTATIYLGGYVAGIEAAVANAQYLGAVSGDTLRLSSVSSLENSSSATNDASGNAQLDCTATALTVRDDTITSCAIDAVQAAVSFDASGKITSDLPQSVSTKNQLGEAYGMKRHGNATYEWNEQAASFAAYVTGKTAKEVAGIAVDESTKPAEADLLSSVTIKIGDFQAMIAKAMAG